MGEILAYAIQSAVFMTGLYLIYKWLLSSETFHAFNRGVILAIYAISLIAPALLTVPDRATESAITATPADITALMIPVSESDVTVSTGSIWLTTALYLYIAGIAVMTARLFYTGIRIAGLIRSGEKIAAGPFTIVITGDSRIAPFSWGRYIVMNRDDYNSAENAITIHEAKHIACRHWLDLLLAETFLTFNWFSPAAWLLKEEMRTVHEYQADMAVISSGSDARSYQMLLIKKAVGAKFPSLANSLNHSKLKKRITMMLQSRSRKRNAWRALAMAPVFAGMAALVHQPAIAAAIDDLSACSLQNKPVSESETAHTVTTQPADSIPDYTDEWKKVAVVAEATTISKNAGNMNVQVKTVNDEDAHIIKTKGIVTAGHIEQVMIDNTGEKPLAIITMKDSEQENDIEASAILDGKPADIQIERSKTIVRGEVKDVNGSLPVQDPALFVNNVRIEKGALNNIDPGQIESITVKKDEPEYPQGSIYVTLKSSDR